MTNKKKMAVGYSRLDPIESEIAFVIARNPREIAQDIAQVVSIDRCDLISKPSLTVRDTYFDTGDGFLEKKRISLRIRRVNGKTLVGIKADPHELLRGGVQRKEVETSWSRQSLQSVKEVLKLNGLRTKTVSFSPLTPARVVKKMGFVVIQERRTERAVRAIFSRDLPRLGQIGELDIDKVRFLGSPPVEINEVEIEAKGRGSMRQIQRIAQILTWTYPGFLKVWKHGKLATGLAIRRLLMGGELITYLGDGGLSSKAYSLIEQAMASGRP